MKTINAMRQYIPVIILSFAMMAVSVDGSAQNHRKDNKSEKKNDRKEYRTVRSAKNDARRSGNDYRYKDGKDSKKQYSDRYNGKYEYNPRYSKKQNHSNSNYVNHPKYGRVYQRFDHSPVVFRHSHGNYYYFGNNFYSYRKGLGYYVVEAPRHMYFSDLPFRCERVYANGKVYFRNGDLFFSYSPRGYVIVPSPFQVNFSVRF